ncbi:MAG TPA: response regulator transcription factor [Planctomycetota bacterium]|nr:response regulator transcription factor [Planctomycetota bacterium]
MTPAAQRRIRVLLVDDHPVVRDGLRSYLEKRSGIDVAGEAGDGLTAVELARRLSPDVVLMDHTMPGMTGIEAVGHLRYAAPRARVVILTMQEDREYVREARRAGACGYLLKDAAPSDLVHAIEAVHAGDPFYTCGASRALLEELTREIQGPRAAEDPALSRREKEVLALLAAGLPSREIAAQLRLGVRTVETHRLRLRRKLGIKSTAGLTKYAIERGLASAGPGTSLP